MSIRSCSKNLVILKVLHSNQINIHPSGSEEQKPVKIVHRMREVAGIIITSSDISLFFSNARNPISKGMYHKVREYFVYRDGHGLAITVSD